MAASDAWQYESERILKRNPDLSADGFCGGDQKDMYGRIKEMHRANFWLGHIRKPIIWRVNKHMTSRDLLEKLNNFWSELDPTQPPISHGALICQLIYTYHTIERIPEDSAVYMSISTTAKFPSIWNKEVLLNRWKTHQEENPPNLD